MADKDCKDFSLETILSVIFVLPLTVDPQNVKDLISFVVGVEPTEDEVEYYIEAKECILRSHPELSTLVIPENEGIFEWLDKQKKKYGNKLTLIRKQPTC